MKLFNLEDKEDRCTFLIWPPRVYWDRWSPDSTLDTWPPNAEWFHVRFMLRRPFRIGIKDNRSRVILPNIILFVGWLRIKFF